MPESCLILVISRCKLRKKYLDENTFYALKISLSLFENLPQVGSGFDLKVDEGSKAFQSVRLEITF